MNIKVEQALFEEHMREKFPDFSLVTVPKLRVRGGTTEIVYLDSSTDNRWQGWLDAKRSLGSSLMTEQIIEAAQQSGFECIKSCCNVPLKTCSTDQWQGDLRAFSLALSRIMPQQIIPTSAVAEDGARLRFSVSVSKMEESHRTTWWVVLRNLSIPHDYFGTTRSEAPGYITPFMSENEEHARHEAKVWAAFLDVPAQAECDCIMCKTL